MDFEKKLNNPWRKIASSIYQPPKDSKIYGAVQVDVGKLENFINEKRSAGIKVTYTQVFIALVSRAIAFDVPQMNAYVKRGKIISRESVNVMVSVLLTDKQEMGSIMIKDAHKRTIDDICGEFESKVNRKRKDSSKPSLNDRIARIPWPFRTWFFRLFKWLFVTMGIEWKSMGIHNNSFGSFILSNIGSLGLDVGFPALFPLSNLSMVLIMGKVEDRPVVDRGEIVVKKMMNFSVSLDHRIVDGSHGGKLFRSMKSRIEKVEELDRIPSEELEKSPFK